MKSFMELARESAPLLVVDAASTQIQVACVSGGGEIRSSTSEREAGIGIFLGLENLGVDLSSIRCLVYCEGPGSILGIRTAAMALRTWQLLFPRPIHAYRSLEFLASARGDSEATYIVDARRGHWHAHRLGGDLRRVLPSELQGPLVTPKTFRAWMAPPSETLSVDYHLDDLISRSWEKNVLRPSDEPDAYLAEAPVYATWKAQVHRAP